MSMSLKVMSFNLRVNTPVDLMHAWPYRRDSVFRFLQEMDLDLIGFQEVTPDMYEELKHVLTQYDYVGLPRDDQGEACPIFYKREKFKVMDFGTFWLTDTPFVESVIEGSAFKRIASYVILKTNESQPIAFFNTHLDYLNGDAIFNQAEYVYRMMQRMYKRYHAKLILTGDFNQHPDSHCIRFLSTALEVCYQDEKDYGLTFHNYSHRITGQPIDYVFYEGFVVKHFQIIHHQSNEILSDHYPIYVIFDT